MNFVVAAVIATATASALPCAQASTQPLTHLLKCSTDAQAMPSAQSAEVQFALRVTQITNGAGTHQETLMNVTLSDHGTITDRALNVSLAGDINNGRSHWVTEMTPTSPGPLVRSFSLDLSYEDSPIVLTTRDGRQYSLKCVEIAQ